MIVRKLSARTCSAWLLILAAFVTLVLRSTPAFAQAAGSGVLTGTVVDSADKKPLADAVVTATSPDLQGEQVVVSDAAGFFRIPDLPSGVYAVRFEKDGYKTGTRDGIKLRVDATLRVNAELLPDVVTSEVTVTTRAPVIDVGSSSIGQNINSDFVKRVPVAAPDGKGGGNRSFEAVSDVTPGAKGDAAGESFAGSSSPENNYIIDGLSVSNPGFGIVGTPLSTEFIKETNVISGGYMPEYGRTMGAVLNVVTNSGSNEFHGGFFSYYSPGSLTPSPRPVTVIGPSGYVPVVANTKVNYVGDVGADVGGPIIRDKLWFYTGVDVASTEYNLNRYFQQEVLDSSGMIQNDATGNPISRRIPNSDQTWIASSLNLQAIAKLTWAMNPDNKLTGTFVVAPNWSGGNGKLAIDPVTGSPDASVQNSGTFSANSHTLNSSAYDANLKWSTEFANKRILVDTTAGYHYEELGVLPGDGSQIGSTTGFASMPGVAWYSPTHSISDFETGNPALTAACKSTPQAMMNGIPNLCPIPPSGYYSGGPAAQTTATNRLALDSFYRFAVGSTITYLLQAAGHHVMKAGFNVEFTQYDHLKAHTGGANMAEGNGSATPLAQQSNPYFVGDTEVFGTLVGPDNAVINEPWHVKPRSTIAGGFIQDSWSVMDVVTLNVGVRYDSQEIYSSDGKVGISMPNQWSPRVGLIWDPTQEGRAKLFANYARYYENMPLSIGEASLTGEGLLKAVHPAVAGDGSLPGACDVRVPPYCNNAAGRSIQSNNTPSQYWTHSGFGQDPVDPDTQATNVDDIVTGGEYEIFKDARLGVTYQKRWINRWIEDMSADGRATFFIGNPGYGWGSFFPKAERAYDAGTLYLMKAFANDWLASVSYTLSYLRGNVAGCPVTGCNHGNAFDAPELLVNASGPLPGDNSHQIKVFGAKDWVIDPHNTVATGVAFNAMSGSPTNFFGSDIYYGTGINYLVPAGTGKRLPWTYELDANLGYKYSFDKDKSLSVGMDIFNLLNLEEVLGVDDSYTSNVAVGKQNGTLRDVHVIDSSGAVRGLNQGDVNPNFGNPTVFQTPRRFRFNVRGTF
jgi:hypothetical protein